MVGCCDCCGKKTDRLFKVSSFEDLIKLAEQFEEEREASMSETERILAGTIDFLSEEEEEYWAKQKKDKIAAARKSKAVEAFNEEGDRQFCQPCSQTIYDALAEGIPEPASRAEEYDNLSDDELLSLIQKDCEPAKCNYYQAFGDVYEAEAFDNSSLFLYKVKDNKGVEHSFSLTVDRFLNSEGNIDLCFMALEMHKLTKAGKSARNNTDTDYYICHNKMCLEGEDPDHKSLVGFAELIEKIKDVINTQSLSESHHPIGNGITINGHHYSIDSIGTIIPTNVSQPNNYRSMADREWDGGEYGFMIDGKLFSGEELALMFSSHEGWQIKFFADDQYSQPLRSDESLMQIKLSQKDLVDETVDLIDMLSAEDKFEREKDQVNFEKLFKKTVFEKFKLYHDSRPLGFGKLAGMELIKKLKMVEGTEHCQEMVQEVMR